jgi:hypothetical protein
MRTNIILFPNQHETVWQIWQRWHALGYSIGNNRRNRLVLLRNTRG